MGMDECGCYCLADDRRWSLFWDYNRTKVYYYKDYVEQWGVPQGIGELSSREMSHVNRLYRFEYKNINYSVCLM